MRQMRITRRWCMKVRRNYFVMHAAIILSNRCMDILCAPPATCSLNAAKVCRWMPHDMYGSMQELLA